MSVLVIGAVNMDIGAHSQAALVPGDSNPGKVTTSLGGVGRNIAHNLCLLGVETAMLTVLGDDDFAQTIRKNAAEIGLDLSLSAVIPGGQTSTYLYINDCSGDMALAVNDMAIYEHMTPAFLEARIDAINAFDMVVLDANPPEESIRWLCENCTVPIICDPVSAIKGRKLRGVLGHLYALKPNRMEGEMLTGERSPAKMAEKLLAAGLQKVFISLGADGLYAASAEGERCEAPCPPIEMANATGGGDALTAVLTACLLRGDSLVDTAENAIAAGAFACTVESTIHPHMSWESIERIRNGNMLN